jgi:YidC/Oxa1 family membrane protein insertase
MSNAPKDNRPGPKKDLSMEMRLLLAFALMGIVLYVTPYIFKSFSPPPPSKPAAAQKQKPEQNPAPPVAEAKPVAQPASAAKKPAVIQPAVGEKEEIFTLETDLYKVEFSNRGGVVRHWILKKYTDDAGKPIDVINTAAVAKVGYPFQIGFEQQKPAVDFNTALFVVKPDPDGLGITYEFVDGALAARKTFRFQKNHYLLQVSTEVMQNGASVPHLIVWRGGFGDPGITNPGYQHTVYFDTANSKLITHEPKAAKDGPVTSEGAYSFAGLEDTYFAAVFLPTKPGPIKLVTFSDAVPAAANPKEEPHVGAGIGGAGQNELALFVGPKDIDILTRLNPQLVNIVDFGWFSFLAKPLFLALHYVNDKWVHNYGWAIVIVTIFINVLLFPLKLSNLKSMKKMQALQPQIAAINEKYKGIGMRDPRKQQQNEEVMGLYKKHGANPMGGCLPMLIQIPFFIAFYKVLSVAIELRQAKWLWVTDLSGPEHLPIKVLPIAMIATQFIVQKMTPTASVDPNQQRLMLLMPLIMGFFFYGLPSGLVLYYLTANIVGIAQQWFFNKTVTVADLPQPVPATKKQNGRSRR